MSEKKRRVRAAWSSSGRKPSKVPIVENDTDEIHQDVTHAEAERIAHQKKIIKLLEFGDIFAVTKACDDVANSSNFIVDEEIINKIGNIVKKYADSVYVPLEVAENFLTHLSSMVESDHIQAQLRTFVVNTNLINSLISIFVCFSRIHVHHETIQASFLSHSCYEKCLYVFLGLIENPVNLAHFLSHITMEQLRELFVALGSIILVDILYLTQELALEILARISHALINQNSQKLKILTSDLIPEIRSILLKSKEETIQLLCDMRPFLAELNHRNFNIESYRIHSIQLAVGDREFPRRKIDCWLDLCQDQWCLQIVHPAIFMRMNYDHMQSVLSSPDSNYLQIDLQDPSPRLLELFKIDKIEHFATAKFYFPELEDADAAKSFLDSKLLQVERAEKVSVATTKGVQKKIRLTTDEDSIFSIDKIVLGLEISSSGLGETVSTISSPDMATPEKKWNRRQLLSVKEVNQRDKDPLLETGVEGSKIIVPAKRPKRPRMTANQNQKIAKQFGSSAEKARSGSFEADEKSSSRGEIETFAWNEFDNSNFNQSHNYDLIPEQVEQEKFVQMPQSLRKIGKEIEVNKEDGTDVIGGNLIGSDQGSTLQAQLRKGKKRKATLSLATSHDDKENLDHSTVQSNKTSDKPLPQKKHGTRASLQDITSAKVSNSLRIKESAVKAQQENVALAKKTPAKVQESEILSTRKRKFDILEGVQVENNPLYQSLPGSSEQQHQKSTAKSEEAIGRFKQDVCAFERKEPLRLSQEDKDIASVRRKSIEFHPMPDFQTFSPENTYTPILDKSLKGDELSSQKEKEEEELMILTPLPLRPLRDSPFKAQIPSPLQEAPQIPATLSDFISESTALNNPAPSFNVASTSAFQPTMQPKVNKVDKRKYQTSFYGKEDKAKPPHLLRAGSHDDEDVISILMMEIVAMQKKRAKRKRARQLSTIAANAETHLLQFTQQWFQYVDSLLYDSNDTLSMNLQNLLQHHLKPLETSMKELYCCKSKHETEHENQYQAMQSDYQSYLSEIRLFYEQRLKEKKQLCLDIEQLRKNCYERVEKEIRTQQPKDQSSLVLNKREELLKQLDAI